MADGLKKGSWENVQERIKEQEELLADYKKRLDENPGDAASLLLVNNDCGSIFQNAFFVDS